MELYEIHNIPSELDFHRTIMVLAARLGLLARDLRHEITKYANNFTTTADIMRRQQRVQELQDLMKRTWNAQTSTSASVAYSNEALSVQARGIFEHVSICFAKI